MGERRARARIEAFAEPAYLPHAELTRLVEAFAVVHPPLCRREAIGRSPEGREIWALTISGEAGGAPETKPGILIEANIHAGEVTGSAAALYTVKQLLEGYGHERSITALLDRITLYVLPRLAVDGAERYLCTPETLRSSPLPYPDQSPPAGGLLLADMDGDGRIRLMRKADPLGPWKQSALDPRILIRRLPEDWEGTFYQLYTEGRLGNGEEVRAIRYGKVNRGLDFNRNFPAHWSPEAKQPGAGRYPLDQAETRALADFMLNRPNISLYLALHTSGGVLLRPPSLAGDESISPTDLRVFEALGALCQRSTGYPCRSSHFAFSTGQTKGSKDWAYEHLGLVAFTLELWDLDARSGAHSYREVGARGLAKLTEAEREQDELRRLQWNDRELAGAGFAPWTRLEHPQLGEVEIGGWDEKWVRQNCPLRYLKEECRKVAAFVTQLGFTLPRLALGRIRTERLPAGAWRVEAEVQNLGYLSTSATRMAVDLKAIGPVAARITLPEGAALVAGRREQALGQLDGYSAAADPAFFATPGPIRSTAWAEWVIDAPEGSQVSITVSHARAGNDSREFRLEA